MKEIKFEESELGFFTFPVVLFLSFFRWTMMSPFHERNASQIGEYSKYTTNLKIYPKTVVNFKKHLYCSKKKTFVSNILVIK
jgi:hypothetical protein